MPNHGPARAGRLVLYVMEQAQRTRHNPALEYAVQRANELDLPVLVLFPLWGDDLGSGRRQKRFLLEGLAGVQRRLAERGIGFAVVVGPLVKTTIEFARDAALVVLDKAYLRNPRRWRREIADLSPTPVVEVEADLVVPVETASPKREHAARTIRPKITRLLDECLVLDEPTPVRRHAGSLDVASL